MELSVDPLLVERGEDDARAALTLFARSLDWAEDTDEEETAHQLMDEAGSWVRRTYGCQLSRSGTQYRQRCPVALAHNRIGMSVGGTAVRACARSVARISLSASICLVLHTWCLVVFQTLAGAGCAHKSHVITKRRR